MRILISGAGIAGLSLAYWLHEHGHKATIIEKAPDIRTEGYMIDFGGTGWDVANKMGLIPYLEARQHQISAINFLNNKGNIAASIDVLKLFEIAGVADKFMTLNRRDIVEALYDYVKSYTCICFDMTITDIKQTTDSAQVTFSDGTSTIYDLVIGADGIHSHVRNLTLGDEDQFTKYLGYHFAIFIVPALKDDMPNGYNMYLEPGIQVSVNQMPDGQWMVFVTLQHDSLQPPPHHDRNAMLKRQLSSMGWICSDIADAIHDATYIFYDTITQIVNPTWSKGRVVLIGDAAHCPTLVSGQGASMAMAGAYFLSQALSENDNLDLALQDYDTRLRPHIDRIQQKAQEFAPNFVPATQWRITLIQWVMKFSNAPFIKTLIGKQFAIKSIFESQ